MPNQIWLPRQWPGWQPSHFRLQPKRLLSILARLYVLARAAIARELGMMRKTVKPNEWTEPAIRRLGKIKHIAGAQGVGSQGAGAKT